MKIVVFLILPILIALMWHSLNVSSATLKLLEENKEPVLDPMQTAFLPEVISLLVLSFVSYVVVNIFVPVNSVEYVAYGQVGLVLFLSPFVLKYWLALKRV